MANVRIERVVSVTSEIKGHLAKNILRGEIDPKISWLCEKGSNKASVILQLERPTVIKSIHIGNAHSAFIEILVGTAAEASDQFESLVPVSSLMAPKESASGSNQNRTRVFIKSDFSPESLGKAWDRLKVVCSQPFNKQVPFGLCFIHVQGEGDAIHIAPQLLEKISKKQSEDDIEIGSFFKKKRLSEGSQPLGQEASSSLPEKEFNSVKENPKGTTKMKLKEKVTEKKTKETSPAQESEKKVKPKTPSPQKRKAEVENKKKEDEPNNKKRKTRGKRRSFDQLLKDVVFVLSGFQNPLRGNIRNLALEMGAKYSPDWEDGCTHLVCACENTPKYKQVKGKGKIVKKEWLEKCHADRKRYPWRRFALLNNEAQVPESEEEIEEEIESCASFCDSSPKRTSRTGESSTSKPKKLVQEAAHREETSLPVTQDEDDYNMSTDEDEGTTTVADTSTYPMPYLPDFLAGKSFYVDPNVKNKSSVERYIVAYNGRLSDTFSERVQYYLTEKGGPMLDTLTKKVPNVVVVKPSWICDINAKRKYIPPDRHLVK